DYAKRPGAQVGLALERRAVVELDDADAAGRGRLHAQLAEHTLVEVLFNYPGSAVRSLREDVHRTDFGQLLRQIAVSARLRRDLDTDEHGRHWPFAILQWTAVSV